VIDEDLSRLFTRLHVTGALDNTVLLMMGDHGNRFDPIRKTVIGRVEERMPFLAVSLPKKLEHFRKNLEANSNVLMSWHDVYEMLMDVAMDNLKPVSKKAS
jgi:arylsulfatase A-like enzyme